MSLSWKQISVAQGNPYQKKESKPNKVIVKTFLPVNIWFSKAAAARGQYLHSRTDTIHWISETVAARWERIFTARGFLSFPKLVTFHIFDHEIQHIFYILAQYTHSLIESFMHDMLWYLFFPILLYSVPFHSIFSLFYKSDWKVKDLEWSLADCNQQFEKHHCTL